VTVPDPQAVEIIFDPHVALALCCLAVALLIVLVVALIPIEDDPQRRGRQR